jgi:predicted MFS family arabinose efflux permease
VGGSFGWLAGGSLERLFGWRGAFIGIGLAGVVLGLLVRATLREPERGRMDRSGADLAELPLGESLRALLTTRSYLHLQLAGALHVFGGYAIAMWLAAFFQRVHGLELHAVATWLGGMGLVCGLGGSLLGGWICDQLVQRDARWFLWQPLLTTLLALPFTALFLLAPTSGQSLASYVPHALLGAMYGGPIYAMTQAVVKVRQRALAAAVHLFTVNAVGLGLGPLVVGALNDALRAEHGDGAIRYTMLLAGTGGHLLACIFLVLATRHVRGDVEKQARPSVPYLIQEIPS